MKIHTHSNEKNALKTQAIFALGLLLSLGGPGCKVLLPAHPNSNKRQGESVTIRMLDRSGMKGYEADYKAVFGSALPAVPSAEDNNAIRRAAAPAAAVASVLVGLAVDYVQKELQKEASLYEAQFGSAIAVDDFWQKTAAATNRPPVTKTITQRDVTRKDNKKVGGTDQPEEILNTTETVREVIQNASAEYAQNYHGFEIIRAVGGNECFKVVFGLAPSQDGQFFRVAPLYFRTSRTKAKILSDTTLSYLAPWNWPGKLMKSDGHHVDTTVAIDMKGFWKDKDQEVRIASIAAAEFSFSGYDIRANHELRAAGKASDPNAEKLGATPSGWLLGVPISFESNGTLVNTKHAGTFALKVTITEKDPSNAKQDLEKAATLVGNQKEKILERIK